MIKGYIFTEKELQEELINAWIDGLYSDKFIGGDNQKNLENGIKSKSQSKAIEYAKGRIRGIL